MELTLDQIAVANAGYWAVLKKIQLQRGLFSFENREYQIEPMSVTAKRTCYMKATRGGFSEIEILKSLHGMIHGRYQEGVLYLMPTMDDVHEFSQSRLGPLLESNYQSIGRFVKSGGKGTDTTSLKKIKKAFWYLRGARLSEKRGDVAESTKMKSIGVDKLVFDEVDHMEKEAIAKARGRYYDSPWQEEVFIGNPLVPEEGSDKQFQKSDQRHWFRKCHSCTGTISTPAATTPLIIRTCPELFFMEDRERCIGRRADGTGYIACKKCGREIFIRDGDWIPQLKANSDYMHGYRWSQLTSAVCDPLDILRDYNDPPEGNFADVMRLRLGLPYVAAEDQLVASQVFACCGKDDMAYSHAGPCAMGVDVGIKKHIVIGIRTNRNQYEIIKVISLSAWEDIHDLARKFHVKNAVIDIRPYQDSAKKFQLEEPYTVWLCEYSDNPAFLRKWDNKSGIVKEYRTAIFDETHRLVTTRGALTIPRDCEEIREFARQMCKPYKILETNKKTGAVAYRYKGSNDHYRNALNYFLLAASKNRIVPVSGAKTRQKVAFNEYPRN